MKAPAFQFYPKDFLASPDVQMMNAQEVGAYCLLLFNAWEATDRPGYLPNDERKLMRWARLSKEEWADSRDILLEKFPASACGQFRYNKRLVSEAEKQEVRRERLAANGAKGGRPPKNQEETKPEPSNNLQVSEQKLQVPTDNLNERLASASAIASVNKEPMSDSATPSPDGAGFEVFWDAYGRKEGAKSKMGKQWNGLRLATRQTILNGLSTYRQAKTVNGPQYLPLPQTFLNGRMWEAETYGTAPATGQYHAPAMLDPETDRLRAFTQEQADQPAPLMVYRSAPNRPAHLLPTAQTALPRA